MPINPPIAATGVLRYDWVDPNGVTRDLTYQTSSGLFVSRGATGLGMAPIELADEKIPDASGSLLRHVNVPPRRIELPIATHEDSIGDLTLVGDALRSWFATANERRQTPGYLKVTRPDGTVRQIAAYYAGGLEGDLARVFDGKGQAVVSLYCPDPHPTADAERVRTWTYPFPVIGAPDNEINDGEIEAYPVWKITSSTMTAIAAANAVTGRNWAFTTQFIFPAKSYVVLDTTPASFRESYQVYDSAGANQFRYLNPISRLFWLEPGTNMLYFLANGAAGGDAIELRYWPRYLGLLA